MTNQPSIISCDSIVFVTMPFPPGPATKLIPSVEEQMRIGVDVELRATFDNKYFIVQISNWIRPGHTDRRPEAWDAKVHAVLQRVWDELIGRGAVTGTMPEIVQGHPLDMLPS